MKKVIKIRVFNNPNNKIVSSEFERLRMIKLVILTGNILSMIYGLAILTTTVWLKKELSKLTINKNQPLSETLASYFLVGIQVIFTGIIGSIGTFTKINLKFPKSQEKVVRECLLIRCRFINGLLCKIKNHPILFLNISLLIVIIPVEIAMSLTASQIRSMIEIDDKFCLFCSKIIDLVKYLALTLTILMVSLLAVHICTLIHALNLYNSLFKLNYSDFRKDMLRDMLKGPDNNSNNSFSSNSTNNDIFTDHSDDSNTNTNINTNVNTNVNTKHKYYLKPDTNINTKHKCYLKGILKTKAKHKHKDSHRRVSFDGILEKDQSDSLGGIKFDGIKSSCPWEYVEYDPTSLN